MPLNAFLDLTIRPDGHLDLSLTPAGREEVRDNPLFARPGGTDDKLHRLFEPHLGNGWELFTGGDGDAYESLGAMTGSPIVSDDAPLTDDGEWQIGRVWWLPEYAVLDEVAELMAGRTVRFTLAQAEG